MILVALGLRLGMVGLLWVMFIDITQTDHQTKRQSPQGQDKPLADATRRAGCRHSRSGTVGSVSDQRNIVPEAPQFLHRFYVLRSSMNADT